MSSTQPNRATAAAISTQAIVNWNHMLSSGRSRSNAGTFHMMSISGTLAISATSCHR
jgi:hypothetical protein